MANYENNANLNIFRFPKGGRESILGVIADIFDIDNDFSENEDEFREDTTSMGYETESQRCADEVFEKVKDLDGVEQIEGIANEVIGYENDGVSFMIGNSNFCGDYTHEVISTNDEYILVISYIR